MMAPGVIVQDPRPRLDDSEGGQVTVWAEGKGLIPSPQVSRSLPAARPFAKMPNAGWKVSASSFEPGEGEPSHAVDGDPDTFWHTAYSQAEPRHLHHLEIDLGKEVELIGVRYRGRQGNPNGRVGSFEVYVGSTLAARGVLRNADDEQEIWFDRPIKGRRLRFVALSEVNGKAWASVAELTLLRSP